MASAIRYVSQQNFVLWDVHADDLVVEARADGPHLVLLDAFMAPSEIPGVNLTMLRTADVTCTSWFYVQQSLSDGPCFWVAFLNCTAAEF